MVLEKMDPVFCEMFYNQALKDEQEGSFVSLMYPSLESLKKDGIGSMLMYHLTVDEEELTFIRGFERGHPNHKFVADATLHELQIAQLPVTIPWPCVGVPKQEYDFETGLIKCLGGAKYMFKGNDLVVYEKSHYFGNISQDNKPKLERLLGLLMQKPQYQDHNLRTRVEFG